MKLQVPVRDLQLLIRHIHTDNATALANERRQRIGVTAGATSQIQDMQALQLFRCYQATAVITRHDFVVDLTEHRLQVPGWLIQRAAGICLQVT